MGGFIVRGYNDFAFHAGEMMARKSAGSILIVGIALFWVGSWMWESLGWWTLAVPAILFAVALVWTYLKTHSDTYGLEIIPRSEFCRYGKTLAGIHRTEDLPDDWPPPQCEHPYHACTCRFEIVFLDDERLKQ